MALDGWICEVLILDIRVLRYKFKYFHIFELHNPNAMKNILFLVILNSLYLSQSLAQWTQLSSGTNNTLNEIFFPALDTGFVAGNSGTLLRTVDGGITWTTMSSFTTLNLNDIYFINTQQGFVVGDSGYFAATSDGGLNWSVSYLSNNNFIKLNSVYFTTSLIGYAGGSENFAFGIIFKTIDGGVSWTVTTTPTSFLDMDYKRILFPSFTTGYALSRGYCIKTTDGGDNWFITDTALVNSGGMFSILEDAYFFSEDTGYVVGWYNPFCGYTVNGGVNWADQFVSNNQWYSIDFPSQQTGYMIGWSQLVKTVDGGQTWTDITSALIQVGGIYSMDFTDEVTGYACGDAGRILKTTFGGTTGIVELENDLNFNVFPNPSTGQFYVATNQFSLSEKHQFHLDFFDIFGKLVYTQPMNSPSQFIDLNLIDGVYLMKLTSDSKSSYKKIVLLNEAATKGSR